VVVVVIVTVAAFAVVGIVPAVILTVAASAVVVPGSPGAVAVSVVAAPGPGVVGAGIALAAVSLVACHVPWTGRCGSKASWSGHPDPGATVTARW